MRLVILYSTTDGQTRKIARHAADRFAAQGHGVELLDAADADDLPLGGLDGLVMAGSVHAGRYQGALVDFARRHKDALAKLKTLFLSVSLAAAGDDPEDREGLKGCVDRFTEATGWTPGRVEHVAGAFRFSDYDFFRYWAMRWIASQKDETVVAGQDREYTDWAALSATLDDWLAG